MSDFDAALERLISDPAFRDALAADPAGALAGYHLSPDEFALLESQLDTGSGGQRHVEQRTSKASLFGLLTPMSGMGGFGSAVSDAPYNPGAPYDSGASFGSDSASGRSGASFGADAGRSGASFGSGPDGARAGASFGTDALGGTEQASFGAESGDGGYQPRHGGGDVPAGRGIGAAMGNAGDYVSDGGVDEPPGPVYDNAGNVYGTRVDANGDGRWDQFTTIDRGGQGVDLAVDRDHDGRVDWVGHDLDRDGLIDEASVDHDNDGVLETRWVDRDGDGWLDTRQTMQPPPPEPAGSFGTSAGAPDEFEAQYGSIREAPPQHEAQRGYIERG